MEVSRRRLDYHSPTVTPLVVYGEDRVSGQSRPRVWSHWRGGLTVGVAPRSRYGQKLGVEEC